MTYEALLFDLDGTLIYFEPEQFIKTYLGAAAKFFIDLIPNPESFYQELLKSTDVMENSDNPTTTALEDFLNDFCPKFDVDCDKISQRFLDFYQTDFDVIKPLIHKVDGAKELLQSLKKNLPETKLILATNPVFPFIAIQKRMIWGGISEKFFDHITHAENSYYCKNNENYWLNIAQSLEINPQRSMMIGNDAYRDLHAKKYGYQAFLIEPDAENEDTITAETRPDYKGTLFDLKNLLIS